MTYKEELDLEIAKLRENGFKQMATIWGTKEHFALSIIPVDGKMPDTAIAIKALITILKEIEQRFNSTEYDLDTCKVTWPSSKEQH